MVDTPLSKKNCFFGKKSLKKWTLENWKSHFLIYVVNHSSNNAVFCLHGFPRVSKNPISGELPVHLKFSLSFTHNIWQIQPLCPRSKVNMDEICRLKFHLLYVDKPQDFFRKFLNALTMSFPLLNLYFWAKFLLYMR